MEERENEGADTAELELLMHEEGADRDFNLKKKRKRDANDEDVSGFQENLEDNRLKKMFEDPDFALDPTHPSFKKPKTMDNLLRKTRARKKKLKCKSGVEKPEAGTKENEKPDLRI